MVTVVPWPDRRLRAGITRCPLLFTQSGQWKPTGAWVMHSEQMGLSHRWQVTAATRLSWR